MSTDAVRRGAPAAWRTRLRRIAPWLLAALVASLLAHQATRIDWAAVGGALRGLSTTQLALATALGIASHALYASFDLVTRRLLRHGLSAPRTALIALTSYAFNLNFGALLGGMALRLRLYVGHGVPAGVATQVIAWSLASNWLGYALTAGAALTLAPPALPPEWPVGRGAARAAGVALLGLGTAWLVICARNRRRELRWREHRVPLPSLRVALLQALLSSANWLLLGAIVWLLLGRVLPYATVLATLQVAAVAGVLTHVPAGLGVLEAVFLALLGTVVPAPQLLAGLLAYRATYYLLPLAWAVPAYFLDEARRGAREGGVAPRR